MEKKTIGVDKHKMLDNFPESDYLYLSQYKYLKFSKQELS